MNPESHLYVTEPGKRAQLAWSIIFYFFTLLEPALYYLPMATRANARSASVAELQTLKHEEL